jgi:hypothetical protein
MEIIYKILSEIRIEENFDINYSGENGYKITNDNLSLYPLLISPQGLLIDGYKRYKQYSDLGKSSIPCLVLRDADSPSKCADYRFITLIENENLDILQKLKLLRFVEDSITSDEIARSWKQKLNLPRAAATINKLKTILSWPPSAHAYIHVYRMGHNQLKLFLDMGAEDISILFKLATDNNLRPIEFLNISTLVKEISLNNSKRVYDILSYPDVCDVFNRFKENRSQLLFHLKSALKQQRYPMLTEYQKRVSEIQKSLSLNSNINISYDKVFESGVLTIRMNISEINELRKCLTDLDRENNQYILSKMIDML